jgi:CubicO group peptidase (beta-lactamase class C family)
MWSMTKVLTNAVALRLYEEGLFKLEDPVGDYVPSFQRTWNVVVPLDDVRTLQIDPVATQSVDYYAFVKGETQTLHYTTTPAKETMRIKHLMSETSGIQYDQFSEYDERSNGAIGCGMGGTHVGFLGIEPLWVSAARCFRPWSYT